MNYIKIQQDLLPEVLNTTGAKRGVYYTKDAAEGRTLFFNSAGSAAWLIPNALLAIDLTKCYPTRLPFKPCPREECFELTDNGEMQTTEKKPRAVWRTKNGVPIYLDPKLLAKFGKALRLFQDGQTKAITVTEQVADTPCVVGYIMPCRPPKKTEPTEG